MQERETDVEFTHTIEEALEPLASKDPKIIKAFLITSLKYPASRLSIWGLATLLSCDSHQYPGVNDVPEIIKLRQGDLTELEKRHFIDEKAIVDLGVLFSKESETEFSLAYPSHGEAMGVKDANLGIVDREIAVLTKFRQALRLIKGAGPSIGETPGKSSV